MKYVVFSDGGARGNPGIAGIGCAVYQLLETFDIKNIDKINSLSPTATYYEYIGKTTNSVSEWTGVLKGLDLIIYIAQKNKINLKDCDIFGVVDSELVQKQIMGVYKVKDSKMKEKYAQFLKRKTLFKSINYFHIPREKNKLCDQLSNIAMDEGKVKDNY